MKKLTAYIEIDPKDKKKPPAFYNIWTKKPSKREIDNLREFGYEIYKCEIRYKSN